MQDTWKEYRNIVRGGFFFNDSVIVLADYSDADKDIEEQNTNSLSDIKDISKYKNEESTNEEAEIHKEYGDEVKDSRDIVKVDSLCLKDSDFFFPARF